MKMGRGHWSEGESDDAEEDCVSSQQNLPEPRVCVCVCGCTSAVCRHLSLNARFSQVFALSHLIFAFIFLDKPQKSCKHKLHKKGSGESPRWR